MKRFGMFLHLFNILLFQIAAVCDFYTYIRYIYQGLVKSEGNLDYLKLISIHILAKFLSFPNFAYISDDIYLYQRLSKL